MRLLKFFILASVVIFCPSWAHASTAPDATMSVKLRMGDDGLVNVSQIINYNSATTFNWNITSKYRNLILRDDTGQITPSTHKNGAITEIRSSNRSSNWTLEYQATDSLIRHNNRDQIFVKIFQEPGNTFDSFTVDFSFENGKIPEQLSTNLYAIGGVSEVARVTSETASSYRLDLAGPKSIVTFSASWEKDFLPVNLTEMIRLNLMNLELLPWLVVGMFLPLLGLLTLIHLLWQRRSSVRKVVGMKDGPPETLSPIIVGVLVNKKIFEKEIVATLVDFCQRGYLVIVHKNNNFFLSKRRPFDSGLADWESTFLEQLFDTDSGRISEDNLTDLSKESLYSPRIKQAFDRVYEITSQRSYFKENPHITRMRYKFFAIVLYFLGLASAIWVIAGDQTGALLLPLAGTMIFAWLIIQLSPQLSSYTDQGEQSRQAWLEFANYLKQEQPFAIKNSTDSTFEKYLAYAIVLGVTEDWAKRFENSNRSTLRPEWFISYQDQSTMQFVVDITAFAKSISTTIDKMRGPLVS